MYGFLQARVLVLVLLVILVDPTLAFSPPAPTDQCSGNATKTAKDHSLCLRCTRFVTVGGTPCLRILYMAIHALDVSVRSEIAIPLQPHQSQPISLPISTSASQ